MFKRIIRKVGDLVLYRWRRKCFDIRVSLYCSKFK